MSGNAPTVLHKAGLRDWPRDLVGTYVGPDQDVYYSHATGPALRATVASGGSVSALLIHLLETGQVQGALVPSRERRGARSPSRQSWQAAVAVQQPTWTTASDR